MSIELLYIIPIVALAIFVFIAISYFQKKQQANPNQITSISLEALQRQSTNVPVNTAIKSTEARLGEFESTISSFNMALTDQKKVIEKFQSTNTIYNEEIEKLESKVREMHKEYDIVISENYSLRAKVKSMEKKIESPGTKTEDDKRTPVSKTTGSTVKEHSEMNMNLYEDTRLYQVNALDDTKEYDISELK